MDLDQHADAPPIGVRVPVAPATTAIPERPVNRRQRSAETVGEAAFSGPPSEDPPLRGSSSGPVTGSGAGRAALRAQRQAVDTARRKAAKRSGEPVGVPDDEQVTAHGPRRVLLGLVAMVAVALGVLGVYSFVAPPQEASSSTTVTPTGAPTVPIETAVLPPLEIEELEVEVPAPPPTPVLAPVTVLNATDINGLAAEVAAVIATEGWQTSGVGTYLADDIATSTVFYTAGDPTQQQAAESLKARFPQLVTTAERFFEVPAGVEAPGLVVVLTAQW